MNPLAQELNDQLTQHSPHVLEMLSDLGKNLFFPKGILTQSAEAKEKAHKYNATIGIATENGGPMFLQCIQDNTAQSWANVYVPAQYDTRCTQVWVPDYYTNAPAGEYWRR